MESISVADFGADSTGKLDSLPAFNAALAALGAPVNKYVGSPGRIRVPAGNYNFISGGFSINKSNVHLVCDDGAEIRYTGTAPIDSTVLMGNYSGAYGPNSYWGQSIENCTIRGNAHVTKAVLHMSNSASERIANVNLKDGPTCLLVDYGNTEVLDRVLCTQYNGLMTVLPTTGIWIDHANNVSVIAPSVEDLCSNAATGQNVCISASWSSGVVTMQTTTSHGLSTGSRVNITGTVSVLTPGGYNASSIPVTVINPYRFSYSLATNPGLYSEVLSSGVVTRLSDGATLRVGSGLPAPIGINITNAGPVTIEDGTSEANGVGVNIDAKSLLVHVLNMDNEANTLGDVLTSGSLVRVVGGIQQWYIHVMPSASSALPSAVIDGVATGQITVDSGVVGTIIINNSYGNNAVNGATITDNGTNTTILNNSSANGGTVFPNKFYGMQISGDLSSFGFGVGAATKSDDPNGYLPAFQTNSDFIKIGVGPRQFPTCDATHGHGDIWYDQGTSGVTGSYKVCVKDASDIWEWRTLYADGAGFGGTDTFLTGCTLKPAMGTACANAGCNSVISVVTSVSISCPTGSRTFKYGVAQP